MGLAAAKGQLPFWTGVPIRHVRQLVSLNRLDLEWVWRLRHHAGRSLLETAAAIIFIIFSQFLTQKRILAPGGRI